MERKKIKWYNFFRIDIIWMYWFGIGWIKNRENDGGGKMERVGWQRQVLQGY
jgi:hypothetical protein